MEDIKFFYDKQLLFFKIEEKKYKVFSPMNKKYIIINNSTYKLLRHLIDNLGNLNYNAIINLFSEKGVSIDIKDINYITEKLISSEILFSSQDELEENITNFTMRNIINKDTRLTTAYMHLTDHCNLKCWFCYNAEKRNEEALDLFKDKWVEIINKLYDKGVSDFIFTGGEPLLYNDLNTLISTKRNNVKYTLISNGVLLDNEWKEKNLSYLDSLIISWGDQVFDSHNINNRQEQLFKFLNNLTLAEKKKVSVRIIITKSNIDSIKSCKEYINSELGITNILFQNFLPNNLSELKYIPLLEDLKRNDNAVKNLDNNNNPLYQNKINKCGALTSIIAIDHKGDIYPCQALMGVSEFNLGSIFNNDWYEILLRSQQRETFRNYSIEKREGCQGCIYRNICPGGCPANSYNLYGNLNTKPEFACQYYLYCSEMIIKQAQV